MSTSTMNSKTQKKMKKWDIRILTFFIFSSMAATGVILYAYNFPKLIHVSQPVFGIFFGVLCVAASMLANIVLGTYSLLNMRSDQSEKINWIIIIISFVGSIPYGFLCYFSYQKLLPVIFDINLSIIIVIVNTGIGYTAIKNVIKNIKINSTAKKKITHGERSSRIIGMCIGILISVTMYLATCNGITSLLMTYKFDSLVKIHAGYFFAVISWLPVAALFANGNQSVAHEIFLVLTKGKREAGTKSKYYHIALAIFCMLSGTSLAAMMVASFDSTKLIPHFFKHDYIQYAVNHYLLVLALFSSAALNYFAINELLKYFETK
jgi:tetrahydromethanopterin S-methyltransferase subunit F